MNKITLPLKIEKDLLLIQPSLDISENLLKALSESFSTHSEYLKWAVENPTLQDIESSIKKSLADYQNEFAEQKIYIIDERSQDIVGCIGVRPIKKERYCIGYWCSDFYSGKGLMSISLKSVLNELSESSFYLTTASRNIRSIRLAEAAGFKKIRTLRPPISIHTPDNTIIYKVNPKRIIGR
ncbi:GNAT family N-acetyltransferase [Pseudomonas protegens]|uniref:GNAT family N-acetyltransferase n=1 Tax=Pseudomonas protegens TaxID=380021 RepID=UPI003800272D